jgi:hypothetical protein
VKAATDAHLRIRADWEGHSTTSDYVVQIFDKDAIFQYPTERSSSVPSKSSPLRDETVADWSQPETSWRVPSGPSEDLPIYLKSIELKGEYPEKRLQLQYVQQSDRIDSESKYLLVLSAAHGGIHQLSINLAGDSDSSQTLTTRPLPKLSDGDPIEVFIAAERPGKPPVRASNIVKSAIRIAGAPKGEIRYSELLLAPFKAIHWEGDTPQVQIGESWYELISINNTRVSDIVTTAKREYPVDPHAAFERNLIELLGHMKLPLSDDYSLVARRLPGGEETVVAGFKLTSREKAIRDKFRPQQSTPE